MSAFTALNGASPKPTEPMGPQGDAAPVSGEQTQASNAESHPAPGRSPKAQRVSWSGSASERSSFHAANQLEAEASLKRKRSDSDDARRDGPNQERTPETSSMPASANSRDTFPSPGRDYDHREKDWFQQGNHREERGQSDSHPVTAPPQSNSDEQIGDALQRATGQVDHGDYPGTSPEAEEKSVVYGGLYTPEHRQDSILQHDPKKRKRNFSNRTKTGCLTCRKRKKKCDEQKPECSNCVRGGFVCAGYPPQRGSQWPKSDGKASAVPLESKDPSYVPPGAYGMPLQSQYGGHPVKRDSLPHYRGQALRIDPPQGRPLATDDERPTASTLASASVTSPENKLSSMSYTPSGVFPTPVSANTPNTQPPPFGERMAKEYQRVPPLHDLSRTEPETPHPGNQLPQINILHATRTSSPIPPPPQPATAQPPSSSAQVAAQLALSHSQFPARRTQKEEMLSGRNYYPFDKELCLERERCAAACWRFNNLTSPPTNGVSPEERARLFLEILQPRDPIRISPTEASPVTRGGRVGRHVAVETPFTCDYGYNITIGHHVVVGRNCTINDVGEVKIGDNCVIGPNVSIYTATLPIDPKKRQGGQGPQLGKGITIEQDCWIGGGATILPGRMIGRGSTIGAGSIVTKDVPPFTIVAGNPARVLRGIAS